MIESTPLGVLFAILGGLLLLSAFFSGTETALMTLNRYRLRHLARSGHRGARITERLLRRPDRLIGCILLGNNLVNIAAASLTTLLSLRLGGESAVAAGTLILTVVILIFAEVAPKTMAALYPQRLALPAAFIYWPLLKLTYPIVWTLNLIANGVLRLLGIRPPSGADDALSSEELKTVVAEAGAMIPRRHQRMLISILDPYKLRRGDVWHSYDYLSFHCKSAIITTFKVPEITGGHFLVDLKGQRKPQPFRLDNVPPRPREFLLLNVNPLNGVVHRHFKMLEVNPEVEIEGLENLEGGQAMHLFRGMLVSWHISPTRRHERIEEYDWLVASCGLHDIWAILHQEESEEQAETEEVEIGHNLAQPLQGKRRAYRWRQTNFSASGVGVVLPISEARALQVGQLVLTNSEAGNGNNRQRLGVVRRLIHRDTENMEAGIQFLGGTITATRIYHREQPIPILITDRGSGYNRVLITPSKVFRQGRIIEIKTGKRTGYTVKAEKLLESTCCIERFEVSRR